MIQTPQGDCLVSGVSTGETSLKGLTKGQRARLWARVCQIAALPVGKVNVPTLRAAARLSGMPMGSLCRLVAHFKARGLLGLVPAVSPGRPNED